MKKIMLVILAALMLASLAGCPWYHERGGWHRGGGHYDHRR